MVNYRYYNPDPKGPDWAYEAFEIVEIKQSHLVFKHLNKKAKFKICVLYAIPLTEEWLLKLGFEKTYDELVYDKGKFRIEFIIWADDNPEWKIKRFDGVTFSRHSEIKTNYVHQLQNLYHALTGEELTINN